MTIRVAAIDCGTNSIRLLIADISQVHHQISPNGGVVIWSRSPAALSDVTRQMRIVRLGEGVDRTGRLSAAALDRTMTALTEYAGLIAEAKPEAIRMVATSATRDAANSQEFTDRVLEILGVAPEVITGDEEAWLSFTGATRELAGTPLADECLPALPGHRHRRRLHRVRPRRARRVGGPPPGVPRPDPGPLGEHRLRPADRTAPAR